MKGQKMNANKVEHTPGAIRVTRILLAGRERISTEYGVKTAEGLADLIDRETSAPALLAACEALPLEAWGNKLDDFEKGYGYDAANFVDWAGSFLRAMLLARAALAQARGEAKP